MAKTTRVVMPQLGESVHEGTISKWLVKGGDKVVEFEPMLEVDTDKVNAEVPAPVTGILREILAKEGETVQAGAEIAVVEIGSEDGKAAAPPKAAPEKPRVEKAAPAHPAPPLASVARVAKDTTLDSGEHRFSPAVQMQASELKVDLAKVVGTGIGGRLHKKEGHAFGQP